MGMTSKKISQTFTGRAEWKIPGGYFKLLSAVTAVDIELWSDTGGGLVLNAPSADAGFYLKAPFDRIVITTPASQAVSFLVAPEEGGSDRLAGEVSVVDGGKALVLAGKAFIGRNAQAAVAAQNAHVQLWNLNAGGAGAVRLVVERVRVSSPGAGQINLCGHNAALGAGAIAGQAKRVLEAASVNAEVRILSNAGGIAGTTLDAQQIAVNGIQEWQLAKPIVVPPQRGLHLWHSVVNTLLYASFDFFEEPDV